MLKEFKLSNKFDVMLGDTKIGEFELPLNQTSDVIFSLEISEQYQDAFENAKDIILKTKNVCEGDDNHDDTKGNRNIH